MIFLKKTLQIPTSVGPKFSNSTRREKRPRMGVNIKTAKVKALSKRGSNKTERFSDFFSYLGKKRKKKELRQFGA